MKNDIEKDLFKLFLEQNEVIKKSLSPEKIAGTYKNMVFYDYSDDKTNHSFNILKTSGFGWQNANGISRKFSVNPPFTLTYLDIWKDKRVFVNFNWIEPVNDFLPQYVAESRPGIIVNVYDHRYGDLAKRIAGWERLENVSEIFKDIYSQSITNSFVSELDKDVEDKKDNEQRAKDLWSKYVDGINFNDIIGAVDAKQKEIIYSKNSASNIWIDGFAGTGKTVVANEIALSLASTFKVMALYSNEEVASKASAFFDAKMPKKIKVFTYEQLEKIIQGGDGVSEKNKRLSNLANWMKNNFGHDSVSVKRVFVSGVALNIELINFDVITKSKNVDIESMMGLIWIRFKKKMIANVSRSDFERVVIEMEKLNSSIQEEFSLQIKEILGYERFILDESPVLTKYKSAYLFFENTIKNSAKKIIMSYDRFQHEKFNLLDCFVHNSASDASESLLVHKLNVVYRTTKEIFAFASKFSNLTHTELAEIQIPVSIPESIQETIEPIYDKQIKLSDYINSVDELIGNEFLELSIECDVPISHMTKNNLYVIFTRAVARLNIYGEYGKEYLNYE